MWNYTMEPSSAAVPIDAPLLNELKDALTVPTTRSATMSSMQGLLGQVFQWGTGEAERNMHIMFPSYSHMHYAQQQQQRDSRHHAASYAAQDMPSTMTTGSYGPAAATAMDFTQLQQQYLQQQLFAAAATAANHAAAVYPADAANRSSPAAAAGSSTPNAAAAAAAPAGYADHAAADQSTDWQHLLHEQQHEQILLQQQQLQQQRHQQQALAEQRAAAAAAKTTFPELSNSNGAEAAAAAEDDGSSSSDWDDGYQRKQRKLKRQWQQEQRQQQQQQGKRRGRPTKKPGQYSKGYIAIKRYRQRKKSLIEQLEDDVSSKQQLLIQLQEEHNTLLQKQQALDAAVSLHKDLFESFSALRISLQGEDDQAPPAAAGGVSLHQPGSSDQAAAAAAAAAGSNSEQQRRRQQQQQQQGTLDVPVMWGRYRAYIEQASEKIVEAEAARGLGDLTGVEQQQQQQQQRQQQQPPSEPEQRQQQETVGSSNVDFPAFPFNLIESLSLFKFSRFSGTMPDTNKISDNVAAAIAASGPGSSAAAPAAAAAAAVRETVEPVLLNLTTGQHDVVDLGMWSKVAQQITLTNSQKQRLLAIFKMYTAAVGKLNADRQQLQQKLQDLYEFESAVSFNMGSSSSNGSGHACVDDSRRPFDRCDSNNSAQSTSTAVATAAAAASSSKDLQAAAAAPPAAAAAAVVKGSSLLSALDWLQQYQQIADSVEWNLIRGRAMIMLYGWVALELLTAEQKARMCVSSWPYFPLVRAVFGHLLMGELPMNTAAKTAPAAAAAGAETNTAVNRTAQSA